MLIVWWGLGYLEFDLEEFGFVVGFSKLDMNEKEYLIVVQECYFMQFL